MSAPTISVNGLFCFLLSISHLLSFECGVSTRTSRKDQLVEGRTKIRFECGVYNFPAINHKRSASRIVGGIKTSIGEFPWLAMIYYSKSEKHECGGAVINEIFILTAGHCLSGAILQVAGQPYVTANL